jgi:hypothetical protein
VQQAQEAQAIKQAQDERRNSIKTVKELLRKLKQTRDALSKRQEREEFTETKKILDGLINTLQGFINNASIPQKISSEKIRNGTTGIIKKFISPASKALEDAQKLLNK